MSRRVLLIVAGWLLFWIPSAIAVWRVASTTNATIFIAACVLPFFLTYLCSVMIIQVVEHRRSPQRRLGSMVDSYSSLDHETLWWIAVIVGFLGILLLHVGDPLWILEHKWIGQIAASLAGLRLALVSCLSQRIEDSSNEENL